MNKDRLHILLADDDRDDCEFFNEALSEIPEPTKLSQVHDGVELMNFLSLPKETPPDILFLDLNMPRKTGYECLLEIKDSERLKDLPVIIFSTSYNPEMAAILYECGANFYIRKPAMFSDLVKVLERTVHRALSNSLTQPPQASFLLEL